MLSPEGDIRKYVRLIGSLCLVCAVASPVFGAIQNGGEGLEGLFPTVTDEESGYEEIYGEALAKGAEETIERVLKERVISELGLKEGEIDFDVALEKSEGEYSVSAVSGYIHGGGIFADPRKVNTLVNEVCGCACTLIYD